MMHQSLISGGVLIVGAPDILTACLFPPISTQLTAVGAPEPTLHELVGSIDSIVSQYQVIFFETDVSEPDLDALAQFVAAANGHTKLIALVDEDIPLSKVRQLKQAGAVEVLPLAIKPEGLILALDDVTKVSDAQKSQNTQTVSKARVFSVAQTRGGAGATTIAVNLAVTMAIPMKRKQPKPRVLLLDLDLQFGNAGTYLDIEDNGAFYDLIGQETLPNSETILGAVQSSGRGVDVLTAPADFVPLTSMTPELVEHMLDVFRGAYDFIVIDLPRATLDWIAPAIMATDRLVVVSDGSVPCIRQAKRLVDLYRENRLTLPVDLVMNREKKLFFGSETIRDAEALLKLKVASWVPDDPSGERRAIDLGRPTSLVRSKGRNTYRKLAKSLFSADSSTSNDNV